MPIYHSKTWPTSTTMAVVHLRVDQQGRAFSALAGSTPVKTIEKDPNRHGSNPQVAQRRCNGPCKTNMESSELKLEVPRTTPVMIHDHDSIAKINTNSQYVFPPTSNPCTYDCIRSERETNLKRCNCQFSTKTNANSTANNNGLVCKYSEDNLKFIHDAKQFLKSRIKEDNKSDKRKKLRSCESNMTVSTILRSNSCDSNFIQNFNKLKTIKKSLDRSTDSLELSSKSNIFNSKICYCIQLLALSPNSLLKSVQFPAKGMERRNSNSSPTTVCKMQNPKVNLFAKKGRSKSVSHMVSEKVSTVPKPLFRRCNSTIEAPKRRESELDDKVLNGSNLPKTPLNARKTQTLYRHYYPEGGWGWTILVVCVVVSVLDHGMQLAAAVLVHPAVDKFRVPAVHAAGE